MTDDSMLSGRATFEPGDRQILARHWFPIARSTDVSDSFVKAMLLDEPLIAYRVHGELIVARDACPHRGVPLSLGALEAEGIVCAYHGFRYGSGGRCNRIPADPAQRIPASFRLRTFRSVERYGLVWVCLSPPAEPAAPAESAADIPVMPHGTDADYQHIVCPPFDIGGFAGRQLEGFIDVAHFAWIHTATFADPIKSSVRRYETVETPQGFEADYTSNIGNYPIGADGRAPEDFEWLRHFEVHLPFTATLTIHFPAGARLVIMNAASPVTAGQTRLFAPIARNFDKELPVEDAHAYNLKIFEEDRRIVESQTPVHLPLDLSAELHVAADASSIAYRRALKRMGLRFGA